MKTRGTVRRNATLRDLLSHPRVVETSVLDGVMGVMAIHGGLEKRTEVIARRVAERTGASLYLVEQPPDLAWHVPSTRFDPRESTRLRSFLSHVTAAVSLHGFGRPHLRRSVLVGGGNRELRSDLAAALRTHTRLRVVDADDEIPPGLRGRHPSNPVNLPERQGVQLELSHSARFHPHVDGLVDAVAGVVSKRL